jgi:RsiW-degrading membrane proteinase PrsW (M82 family)
MTLLVSILAAVLPSIILLWYFHRQDRYPEPFGVMMMTFLLGILVTMLVLTVRLGNYLVAIQAAKAGEIEEREASGDATG